MVYGLFLPWSVVGQRGRLRSAFSLRSANALVLLRFLRQLAPSLIASAHAVGMTA